MAVHGLILAGSGGVGVTGWNAGQVPRECQRLRCHPCPSLGTAGASPAALSWGQTGGAGIYPWALPPVSPINDFVRLMPIDKIAISPPHKPFYPGGVCWVWGTDPTDGTCAVIVLLSYREENNLFQPFEIMSLATEKSELVTCECYSIRKCFNQKLFGWRGGVSEKM